MRILISNDDGYLAMGIEVLANTIKECGHEIIVVAPESDRSGASSSLTLDRPLAVHKSSNGFLYVNGTPTDCVHLALTGLLADNPPDLLLSGINRGSNMGDDTIYSGTVAAAIEGHLFNIPAIAFSLSSVSRKNLPTAAFVVKKTLKLFEQKKFADDILLNVNIPDCLIDELKGWQITRLGRRHKAQGVLPTTTPNGKTVFWIGAAGEAKDAGDDTDFYAVQNNIVSITPLMLDLTNYREISNLKNILPKMLEI